jgi:hypothetical protein
MAVVAVCLNVGLVWIGGWIEEETDSLAKAIVGCTALVAVIAALIVFLP